jgi:hypothetical protein
MNIKTLTLSILAVTAATIACSQASLADGGTTQRWEYTPNTWKDSGPTPHRRYIDQQAAQQAVSAVQPGSMPGKNILGLSPEMLAKPPAPAIVHTFAATMARPVVAAKMASAAPKLLAPAVPPAPLQAFMKGFGSPISTAPPVVAALPTTPQPLAARPSAPSKPSATHATTSTNIAWTPQHRRHPAGSSAGQANALPIASYGNGVGYQPGSFTVAHSSGGMSTNTAVSGVIVSHKH